MTETSGIRYAGNEPAIPATPGTIYAAAEEWTLMSDRAYVFITVLPGRTREVVRALSGIEQIKTIDPCWGKPDIIVVVEVPDQNALTQLVLRQIHAVDGVAHTDTHLAYRLKDSTAT